ncbi:unnamed protein product [Amoebophrya sp. A25]|nr:unnamed protein product [Amoebophrya sp. A25]|eukprot:GSA25T00013915001.1
MMNNMNVNGANNNSGNPDFWTQQQPHSHASMQPVVGNNPFATSQQGPWVPSGGSNGGQAPPQMSPHNMYNGDAANSGAPVGGGTASMWHQQQPIMMNNMMMSGGAPPGGKMMGMMHQQPGMMPPNMGGYWPGGMSPGYDASAWNPYYNNNVGNQQQQHTGTGPGVARPYTNPSYQQLSQRRAEMNMMMSNKTFTKGETQQVVTASSTTGNTAAAVSSSTTTTSTAPNKIVAGSNSSTAAGAGGGTATKSSTASKLVGPPKNSNSCATTANAGSANSAKVSANSALGSDSPAITSTSVLAAKGKAVAPPPTTVSSSGAAEQATAAQKSASGATTAGGGLSVLSNATLNKKGYSFASKVVPASEGAQQGEGVNKKSTIKSKTGTTTSSSSADHKTSPMMKQDEGSASTMAPLTKSISTTCEGKTSSTAATSSSTSVKDRPARPPPPKFGFSEKQPNPFTTRTTINARSASRSRKREASSGKEDSRDGKRRRNNTYSRLTRRIRRRSRSRSSSWSSRSRSRRRRSSSSRSRRTARDNRAEGSSRFIEQGESASSRFPVSAVNVDRRPPKRIAQDRRRASSSRGRRGKEDDKRSSKKPAESSTSKKSNEDQRLPESSPLAGAAANNLQKALPDLDILRRMWTNKEGTSSTSAFSSVLAKIPDGLREYVAQQLGGLQRIVKEWQMHQEGTDFRSAHQHGPPWHHGGYHEDQWDWDESSWGWDPAWEDWRSGGPPGQRWGAHPKWHSQSSSSTTPWHGDAHLGGDPASSSSSTSAPRPAPQPQPAAKGSAWAALPETEKKERIKKVLSVLTAMNPHQAMTIWQKLRADGKLPGDPTNAGTTENNNNALPSTSSLSSSTSRGRQPVVSRSVLQPPQGTTRRESTGSVSGGSKSDQKNSRDSPASGKEVLAQPSKNTAPVGSVTQTTTRPLHERLSEHLQNQYPAPLTTGSPGALIMPPKSSLSTGGLIAPPRSAFHTSAGGTTRCITSDINVKVKATSTARTIPISPYQAFSGEPAAGPATAAAHPVEPGSTAVDEKPLFEGGPLSATILPGPGTVTAPSTTNTLARNVLTATEGGLLDYNALTRAFQSTRAVAKQDTEDRHRTSTTPANSSALAASSSAAPAGAAGNPPKASASTSSNALEKKKKYGPCNKKQKKALKMNEGGDGAVLQAGHQHSVANKTSSSASGIFATVKSNKATRNASRRARYRIRKREIKQRKMGDAVAKREKKLSKKKNGPKQPLAQHEMMNPFIDSGTADGDADQQEDGDHNRDGSSDEEEDDDSSGSASSDDDKGAEDNEDNSSSSSSDEEEQEGGSSGCAEGAEPAEEDEAPLDDDSSSSANEAEQEQEAPLQDEADVAGGAAGDEVLEAEGNKNIDDGFNPFQDFTTLAGMFPAQEDDEGSELHLDGAPQLLPAEAVENNKEEQLLRSDPGQLQEQEQKEKLFGLFDDRPLLNESGEDGDLRLDDDEDSLGPDTAAGMAALLGGDVGRKTTKKTTQRVDYGALHQNKHPPSATSTSSSSSSSQPQLAVSGPGVPVPPGSCPPAVGAALLAWGGVPATCSSSSSASHPVFQATWHAPLQGHAPSSTSSSPVVGVVPQPRHGGPAPVGMVPQVGAVPVPVGAPPGVVPPGVRVPRAPLMVPVPAKGGMMFPQPQPPRPVVVMPLPGTVGPTYVTNFPPAPKLPSPPAPTPLPPALNTRLQRLLAHSPYVQDTFKTGPNYRHDTMTKPEKKWLRERTDDQQILRRRPNLRYLANNKYRETSEYGMWVESRERHLTDGQILDVLNEFWEVKEHKAMASTELGAALCVFLCKHPVTKDFLKTAAILWEKERTKVGMTARRDGRGNHLYQTMCTGKNALPHHKQPLPVWDALQDFSLDLNKWVASRNINVVVPNVYGLSKDIQWLHEFPKNKKAPLRLAGHGTSKKQKGGKKNKENKAGKRGGKGGKKNKKNKAVAKPGAGTSSNSLPLGG